MLSVWQDRKVKGQRLNTAFHLNANIRSGVRDSVAGLTYRGSNQLSRSEGGSWSFGRQPKQTGADPEGPLTWNSRGFPPYAGLQHFHFHLVVRHNSAWQLVLHQPIENQKHCCSHLQIPLNKSAAGWMNSAKLTCDTPKQVSSEQIVSPVFNLLNALFIGAVLFWKKNKYCGLQCSQFAYLLWNDSNSDDFFLLVINVNPLSDSNMRTSTINWPSRASLIKQFSETIVVGRIRSFALQHQHSWRRRKHQ